MLLGDSRGHEVSRRAEALCVSQYLAQHAAVLALLRAQGVRLRGLLTGVGHSAEFFSHVLQAPKSTRSPDARVVAMEPAALARVTRLPERELAALIENDPLLGHPVRHFARWAGWSELLPDGDPDRLRAFVLNRASTRRRLAACRRPHARDLLRAIGEQRVGAGDAIGERHRTRRQREAAAVDLATAPATPRHRPRPRAA